MAEVKIYRAAYVYNGGSVMFSGWVKSDGMQDILDYLSTIGEPPTSPPEILGWEEKTLDTDPA